MTEGQLRASEWYLSHKLALKKTLMGAIIAVGAIFWIYSLYGFIDWKFVSGPKERANLKTILEIKTANEAIRAASAIPIAFGEPQIFAGGLGKYDLLVKAENQNSDWWIEFEYRFVGEGYEGSYKKGFILPSESKYITDLGVEKPFRPRNPRLEYKNLKYRRINKHIIPDYDKWESERLNFTISGKNFNANIIKDQKNISALSFKAANNTAYDFWSTGFHGQLYKGDQLVSVNYVTAENFKSGEMRDLQMQFYEGLPAITKYEVVPEVNIFDEDVYIGRK